MTDHHPQAAVDCPRCGQRYVDLDIHAYLDAGGTPDAFADMLHRLVRAHVDTCQPRKVPVPPPDRRRRTWWWTGALVPATLFALLGLAHGIRGEPLGWSLLIAAACLIVAKVEQPWAYRSGYWRGRTTATDRLTPQRQLHPADHEWRSP